jgi:hypothetical protein
MGDPLIAIYKDSFHRKIPGRLASEPLPSSELQKVSDEIQSTGKPPSDPRPNRLPLQKQLLAPDDWILPLDWPRPRVAPKINEPLPRLVKEIEESAKPFLDELWNQQKVEYELLFKFYNEMVIREYEEISAFKPPKKEIFDNLVKEGESRKLEPLPYYRFLRPIWYKNKIREPVAFMNTLLFSGVTFAGQPVQQGVHPKFAEMLKRVDANIASVTALLKKTPVSNPTVKPIGYIGCFRPDPVKDRISNHMIGAAIDIDSGNNPFLEAPRIRALDKMLAFVGEEEAKAYKANPLGPSPETLQIEMSWFGPPVNLKGADDLEKARRKYTYTVKISEKTRKFLSDFLSQWKKYRDQKKTPADQTLQNAFEIIDQLVRLFPAKKKKPPLPVEDGLATIQKQGLISVPAEVFIALDSDRDIEWLMFGFSESAMKQRPEVRHIGIDIMHFDVEDTGAFIGSGLP